MFSFWQFLFKFKFFNSQVCQTLSPEVLAYSEIQDFFSQIWAPIICQLQCNGGTPVLDVLNTLIKAIHPMAVYEVKIYRHYYY